MSHRIRLPFVLPAAVFAAALVLVAGSPESALAAQEALPGTRVGEQNLRPYWHVFAAYTIVIVLIGGWAFTIARRLRNLEERLVD
jgi:CcmD family protein